VDQIANEFEFKTAEQVKEEAEAALIWEKFKMIVNSAD